MMKLSDFLLKSEKYARYKEIQLIFMGPAKTKGAFTALGIYLVVEPSEINIAKMSLQPERGSTTQLFPRKAY
jgi:hypothetical protein